VRAYHVQVHGDVPVLVAHRLDPGHLHAGGQHRLQRFHGDRPRERLLIDELVEHFGLVEQLRIGGPLHKHLGAAALAFHLGNLEIDGLLAGARLGGLAIEQVQPDAEQKAEAGEDGHADPQPFDGRAQIGVGAGGEIESDSHDTSGRSRQRAGHAGIVDLG
jgi:hypothetical protein